MQPWEELAVAFDDFMQLARFCRDVGETDGIAKKLVTAVARPLPAYFKTLASDPAPGRALGLFLIGVSSVDAFLELLDGFGGTVVYRKSDAQASAENLVPIYEYTWNHTTLQVLKLDRDVTYLQSAFPDLTLVEQMIRRYGDEVMMHLEFIRTGGKLAIRGLQVVRFTDAERLRTIIREHEENGCTIFNPHTYVIEDGGRKKTDPAQLAFKELTDPLGLLNPGKMRGWKSTAALAG